MARNKARRAIEGFAERRLDERFLRHGVAQVFQRVGQLLARVGRERAFDLAALAALNTIGLLEELRYRLHHPAALLIVLPNGLVKLINALPFICGDLRREPLAQVWSNFRRAWHDPRVASFIDELALDPGRTKTLHEWVRV